MKRRRKSHKQQRASSLSHKFTQFTQREREPDLLLEGKKKTIIFSKEKKKVVLEKVKNQKATYFIIEKAGAGAGREGRGPSLASLVALPGLRPACWDNGFQPEGRRRLPPAEVHDLAGVLFC